MSKLSEKIKAMMAAAEYEPTPHAMLDEVLADVRELEERAQKPNHEYEKQWLRIGKREAYEHARELCMENSKVGGVFADIQAAIDALDADGEP